MSGAWRQDEAQRTCNRGGRIARTAHKLNSDALALPNLQQRQRRIDEWRTFMMVSPLMSLPTSVRSSTLVPISASARPVFDVEQPGVKDVFSTSARLSRVGSTCAGLRRGDQLEGGPRR